MYITDTYLFVHHQKSAGVTVKDFMIQHLGAKVLKYKHAPIRMFPEKYRQKRTTIGCIRNAYRWYVSYYFYLKENHRLKGSVPFKQFIESHTQYPRALMSLMPKKLRKKYPNLYPPKTSLPIGAYSYHYIHYFCFDAISVLKHWNYDYFKLNINKISNLDVTFRVESLGEDMIRLFGEEYRDKIMNFKKRNVTKHKHYTEYYTPEMRSLIEQRDGVLMEYLGYSF